MTSPAPTASWTAGARALGDVGQVPVGRDRRADPKHRRDRHRRGHRDERHEPEEHPAPAERVGDEPGQRGAGQRGHHPRGREDREHPGPHRGRVAAPDHRVRHRGHRPRAQTLDHAGEHEQRHGRREPTGDQPDREQAAPGRERHRRPAPVGLAPGDDRAHERREQVRAEDPAVEREVAEVVLDDRQHRRDRQRLEPHERDREDEAAGERSPGRREDAARVRDLGLGCGHRPIMASP
jgi:hypothetical protein